MFTSIRRSAIALGAALALLAVLLLLAHAGGVSPAPRTALAITATVPSATPTPCLTPGKEPLPTFLGGGCGTPFPTPLPTPDTCLGCKMSLAIEGTLGGSAVTCDSKTGTVQNPAKCTLEQGTGFVVKIVANSIPPAGYIAFQTFLAYGGLGYKPATANDDEIVWPEGAVFLRTSGELCSPPPCPQSVGDEGRILHGALSAPLPPHPISTHAGPLVELQMNCQTDGARLVLLPFAGLVPSLEPLSPGTLGTTYVIDSGIAASPSSQGFLQLDIDNDGQLDREQILKPTLTPTSTPTPNPPTPTATRVSSRCRPPQHRRSTTAN